MMWSQDSGNRECITDPRERLKDGFSQIPLEQEKWKLSCFSLP